MENSYSGYTNSWSFSNSKYYLYLFLIWPFLAFLLALKNYSHNESRKVVYIFLVYIGLTFVITKTGYVDAAGYAIKLRANAALPFTDFFKIVGGLYTSDTSVDFVEPLISFIISRFTSQYCVLFAAYAALFGFFYLKSINLLYNRIQENSGWNVLIHLAFFTAILPITAINGVRMWTAAWIFFYGAYYVILYRDARYFIVSVSAAFVHFSFLSANAVLMIYFFAGNRNYIYLPLALASFVLPRLIAPVFQSLSVILGGAFQRRYDSYSGTDYIAARQQASQEAAWFLKIGYDMVLYYLLLTIVVIQFRSDSLMKEKSERNLFSFLLLFLSFVNFGSAIPSFGGRFLIVFFLFATLYVFIYNVKLSERNISFLTWIGLFPMALFAAIVFRQGSDSINAWIFAPGFGIPLLVPGISLADILFN
jgi:hypothetical protein